jgi:hypothetical protein
MELVIIYLKSLEVSGPILDQPVVMRDSTIQFLKMDLD